VTEVSASQDRERQAAGASTAQAIELMAADLRSLCTTVDDMKVAQKAETEHVKEAESAALRCAVFVG
jgi:hypothetical protein